MRAAHVHTTAGVRGACSSLSVQAWRHTKARTHNAEHTPDLEIPLLGSCPKHRVWGECQDSASRNVPLCGS